jgi:GT2 family glycosyltransferase
MHRVLDTNAYSNRKIDVSIVIVNYNSLKYTAQCLDSIYKEPTIATYEIVLVDNASSDGSPDKLESRYPMVKLVRSSRNSGIAGGNNLGIDASIGKYILLLNNDTLVTPGSIDKAIAFLESHPEAAGVGGNLLNPDGSFQSGHVNFHNLCLVFLSISKLGQLLRPYYPSHPPGNALKEVDWMSTAFMAFRKDALDSVGSMDEEFFIYSDETDLQYRLKQKGYKIYYLPELETIHFGGKSLNPWRRRRLVYRGFLLYFHKHKGRLQTSLLRGMLIAVCLLKLPFWWLTSIVPQLKDRRKQEIISNISILRMCLKPGVEAP